MLRLGAPLVVAGCVFFSLVITVTGGFSATVFGSHVAVHDPMRPFFVATVIGVAVIRGEDGEGSDIGIRYTSVYVLRDSRWQLVTWQSTRIAPNETVNPRRG